MAYETASATSPADLLDKLGIFADANGWTIDYAGAFTGSGGATGNAGAGSTALLLHKGDVFAAFFADTAAGSAGNPGPFLGTAHYPGPYDDGLAPQSQAGKSPTAWTNKIAGPYQSYHFFASGDYLHIVVEVTPGSFRHFGVGQLEKAGAITTGVYAHRTFWDYSQNRVNSFFDAFHAIPFDDGGVNNGGPGVYIRADSDALSPRNIGIADTENYQGWGGFRSTSNRAHVLPPLHGLMRVGPSTLTGRAVLFPPIVAVFRPSGMLSLLGSPPDMRFTRMDHLAPGDLVTLGADNWRVFPIIRQNGPAGQENSENYAIAYRVVE